MSLCGLIVTFILYCCYKDLRNFHGRCIMILSVFLFIAQLLPTLSAYISFPPGICVLSALISHYSWLGAFSWMTVIALNLLHIFRGSLQRVEEWEVSHFCRYVAPAFGFGAPFIIVVISLFLHFTHAEFAYGAESPCWISDSVCNFWAFGVPVGIFLAVNTGLFTVIVVLVFKSQRRSRELRRQQETIRTSVRDLLLCFKVST